ncbi:CidA/LrgA family protein [Dickeya ananatis]|uniref:CidA/LrgA family protein n=1 Tax=Dickeya ananatis TaxID=3061286 RepID=UPI00388F3506
MRYPRYSQLPFPAAFSACWCCLPCWHRKFCPSRWVKPGCQLLIRYMALLFVPIGVGVMNYYGVVRDQFGPIVVSCLVSTFVVMTVVGYTTQMMHRDWVPPGRNTADTKEEK